MTPADPQQQGARVRRARDILRRVVPRRAAVQALVAGLLVALSLPPWGFWPLAFVGVAVFESALGRTVSRQARARAGWFFGAGWMLLGMVWMWFLTAPGYLVAAALFAGFHSLAAAVTPTGPWRVIARPAAHTAAEAIRFAFPWGGVPLATLPISQAAGPFAEISRVGGPVLLTWFVFQVGFSLAGPSPFVPELARKRGASSKGHWHGVLALGVALLVWAGAPLSAGTGTQYDGAGLPQLRIGVVQGGGEQGTHAIDTDSRIVFDRHLDITSRIEAGSVDMVLWPENVIDIPRDQTFADSEMFGLVAAEAARLEVPVVVGITEDTPDGANFLNAQVVVTPEGQITDRYDKVRRVPFGEYMPWRGFLDALGAPTDMVPRDAVAGTEPGLLDLPNGWKLGVVISWEVFFGGRANEGAELGADVIVNPTNGSSYTWTVLQTQQVASSRLRAIEQNRWVVQAAPTGFSAFISPDGQVIERSAVSEPRLLVHEVEPRGHIRTWYSHTGDIPWVVLALLVLGAAWIVPARQAKQARSHLRSAA